MTALHAVFWFSLIAAAASLLRGGRYVHEEEQKAAEETAHVPDAGDGRRQGADAAHLRTEPAGK